MKKEQIRKEFFFILDKGNSLNQCRKILLAQFGYEVSKRTLQRWNKLLKTDEWDLTDKSKRPKTIHYKITSKIEERVVDVRNKTGFGAEKISCFVEEISETSIRRILEKHKLTKSPKRKKKRTKYIRWQREHSNSLWQMDISDQKIEGKYCFAVIDDCSRYCLGLFGLNRVSTKVIVHLLDTLFKVYGKPREILTDNGNVFGLKSKHSQFDRALNRRGVRHIRTAIHSPTTSGKIERFFQTLGKEFEFSNKDPELFRMRYNHFRPHTSLEKKSPAGIYFDFKKLK